MEKRDDREGSSHPLPRVKDQRAGGQREPQLTAPRLAVEVPVGVQKKTYTLKAPTLKLLTEYAAFLSAHHQVTIDEDRVVESLAGQLAKDPAFIAWKEAGHA